MRILNDQDAMNAAKRLSSSQTVTRFLDEYARSPRCAAVEVQLPKP